MAEIPNQILTGTPLSERDCYLMAIEHLSMAAHALRGLAAHRKDARWLIPVRLLDQIVDQVKRLMVKGGARVIWLPRREAR